MFKKICRHAFTALHFSVKNTIRVLFIIVVLAAFLAGSCWFVAVKYFNAQKIGEVITSGLQNTLQRPVMIGSIKLVSLNRIEVKNFKVIDNKLNNYNTFLSADSVVIRYNILPLLKNIVEIKEVSLINPSINIIKDENGVLNTPEFKPIGAQSSRGQIFDIVLSAGKKVQLIIEDWTIQNGSVSYRDIGADISHSLNGIFVKFDNLKFNGFTNFKLNFILRNQIKDKIIETEIKTHGALNLADFKPQEMELKDVDVQLGALKKPINARINVKNFINPSLSFTAALPAFSDDDVSLFMSKPVKFKFPPLKLAAEVNFSELFKKISVPALKFETRDIKLRLKGDIDLTATPAALKADFSTTEFDIPSADYFGILKKFEFSGKAAAEGNLLYSGNKFSMPQFTVNLNNAAAKISNFIITGVKGRYEASENFNVMKANVQDGVFKVGRQTISKIKGPASYNHQKQTFSAFITSGLFNDKKARISVDITKVRTHERDIKAKIYISTLNPVEIFDTVEDFAHALSPNHIPAKKEEGSLAWLHNFRADLPSFMPNFSGVVYADEFTTPIVSGKNINAEFVLKNMLPGMDKLDGKIDIKLENGVIYKLQEAADRWAALGIAFQPFVIMNKMEKAGSFKMGQVLKDTPFETMSASVDFNNGKMDINNFYLDGGVVAAAVGGNVDWIGEKLDLDISTMFKNTSKRGALSENLTDESGEPALAFKTVGTMSKPSVQIRSPKKTGAAIQNARKKGIRTDFSAGQNFIKEK